VVPVIVRDYPLRNRTAEQQQQN